MGNKQRTAELTDKQIAVIKASTQYTCEDIRNWHKGFLQDCPNGRLNRTKFIQIYKDFFPHGNAEKYCKLAFTAFDADGNGSLDFNEFLIAISATSCGNLDERLRTSFEVCDISKDGQIDRKELARLLSALYDITGETDRTGDRDPKKRADMIISQFDVDGDKKLSKAEFIAGCKTDPIICQLLAPTVP